MPKSMPLLSQMEGSLRWMIKNGVQSAEMQLQPDSLGKVAIQLRVERGEVHARLWASEPGTVPLLQSHKILLENSLREQGLHLASFDLQQGSRGGDRDPMEHQTSQLALSTAHSTNEDQQEVPSQSATLLASHYRIEVVA
jgi:flagellar hook-length control protein FliK